MCVHFRSCSFIVFHFLSFSFIFFHFLSFSLSLLDAQNGPQFRYDFSWEFLCGKSIFGYHLGWYMVLLWALFSFFSYFFLPFFVLFLAFYIFIFDHFLFMSFIFWLFKCFSFSFFFFFRRKSFFFSFFLYFFQIFLLLASVSEFNCFLRSRCSMEMWCADDIGRDSWDWVGPPAWGRACFNSPEFLAC